MEVKLQQKGKLREEEVRKDTEKGEEVGNEML